MKVISASLILFMMSINSEAQDAKPDYSSQVSSLDNIIETLYSVISGDAGTKRDWNLFRHLFHSDAKLMPTQITKSGEATLSYLTPQDYIDRSGTWLETNGFHEKELHRAVEEFGNITHVFSTYAAYKSEADTEPFMRGINSIQLSYDNNRWWIANIYWQAESEGILLSEEQLGEK
jgi:hypothetical protein